MTRLDQTRPDQTRPDQTNPIIRNSSLELLRIVAVLMIILSHLAQHGGFDFQTGSVTVNHIWWQFLRNCGARGNDLFVMISGYFLINSQGISFHKLLNLWIKLFTYSLVVLFALCFSGLALLSAKTMLKAFMPITNGWWWFPKAYFVMYLVHPYVNRLLHGLTRRGYEKILIAIIFFYWCLVPAFLKDGSKNHVIILISFICLYSIAGYFRLHAKNFGGKIFIAYGALVMAAHVLVIWTYDAVIAELPYIGQDEEVFASMMSPLVLLSALCLFLGFRRLNIGGVKAINIVASASFGVYLLHENPFCSQVLWRNFFSTASFQNSPYLIPYSVAATLIVYIACTILELARSKIFRTLTHGRLS